MILLVWVVLGVFAGGCVYCCLGCCVGFVLLAFAVDYCCVNSVDLIHHCFCDWFVLDYACRIVWMYLVVRFGDCAVFDCCLLFCCWCRF